MKNRGVTTRGETEREAYDAHLAGRAVRDTLQSARRWIEDPLLTVGS